MFLQHFIKIFFLVTAFFAFFNAQTQPFQTSKYNKEYNPYFKFDKFERGVRSEVLSKKLDALELKNKEKWTIEDSIEFAEISLLTKNIELSQYYLESIVKKSKYSKHALQLLVMDCYLENDFVTGDRIIEKHFQSDELEDKYFAAIYNAHKVLIENNVVDSVIFGIFPSENKTIKKGTQEFNNQIIIPIKKANLVLRFFVKFIHEDDPILAKAFNELGTVLQNYVSLNQAYIAFSIARIYNNKDKNILENVKAIKAEHVRKNYNTPKFRTYFPRIEFWRFDYDILKEKIIREKNDTIPKFTPELLAPKKEPPLPFSVDLLIPIGIGLILLIFVIFTRSKKK